MEEDFWQEMKKSYLEIIDIQINKTGTFEISKNIDFYAFLAIIKQYNYFTFPDLLVTYDGQCYKVNDGEYSNLSFHSNNSVTLYVENEKKQFELYLDHDKVFKVYCEGKLYLDNNNRVSFHSVENVIVEKISLVWLPSKMQIYLKLNNYIYKDLIHIVLNFLTLKR
jgi:hypothetical protein